jgi:MSHA pilin protein MshD
MLMRNKLPTHRIRVSGVSLIEMVVFIVVVSIALLALVGVYRQATINNVDPIIRVQALEAAQSLLDEILSLKYDEKTPTGGIPACDSGQPGAEVCSTVLGADGNFNDVDDYNGWNDTNIPYTGYSRSVTVTANNNIKLITVSVTTPTGETILLAAERANF